MPIDKGLSCDLPMPPLLVRVWVGGPTHPRPLCGGGATPCWWEGDSSLFYFVFFFFLPCVKLKGHISTCGAILLGLMLSYAYIS
jgi:hypothetical protein